jgi:hypothetical protein
VEVHSPAGYVVVIDPTADPTYELGGGDIKLLGGGEILLPLKLLPLLKVGLRRERVSPQAPEAVHLLI